MSYKTHVSSGGLIVVVAVAPGYPWELEELRVHLSAGGGATDLTVTLDSAFGSKHDTVLLTKAMSGVEDYVYTWEPAKKFVNRKDRIVIAYANSGSVTWGIEVIYKGLGE